MILVFNLFLWGEVQNEVIYLIFWNNLNRTKEKKEQKSIKKEHSFGSFLSKKIIEKKQNDQYRIVIPYKVESPI